MNKNGKTKLLGIQEVWQRPWRRKVRRTGVCPAAIETRTIHGGKNGGRVWGDIWNFMWWYSTRFICNELHMVAILQVILLLNSHTLCQIPWFVRVKSLEDRNII